MHLNDVRLAILAGLVLLGAGGAARAQQVPQPKGGLTLPRIDAVAQNGANRFGQQGKPNAPAANGQAGNAKPMQGQAKPAGVQRNAAAQGNAQGNQGNGQGGGQGEQQNGQAGAQGDQQNGQAGEQGEQQNGQAGAQGEQQNGQAGGQGEQQNGQGGAQGNAGQGNPGRGQPNPAFAAKGANGRANGPVVVPQPVQAGQAGNAGVRPRIVPAGKMN